MKLPTDWCGIGHNIHYNDIQLLTILINKYTHMYILIFSLIQNRTGKRYSTTLNLNGGLEHGLTLELGAYVAKIQPGSVAAKEGSIAVGDRIVCVSGLL